jgi:hypothetical protein
MTQKNLLLKGQSNKTFLFIDFFAFFLGIRVYLFSTFMSTTWNEKGRKVPTCDNNVTKVIGILLLWYIARQMDECGAVWSLPTVSQAIASQQIHRSNKNRRSMILEILFLRWIQHASLRWVIRVNSLRSEKNSSNVFFSLTNSRQRYREEL